MRLSSAIGTSCSACTALPVDGEGRADDGVHVLLPARRVVDAVVAHVGRVARRHLVNALGAAPHAAQLAAESVGEDLRPVARLLGRLLERVELRLLELGGDVGERSRGDVAATLEEAA